MAAFDRLGADAARGTFEGVIRPLMARLCCAGNENAGLGAEPKVGICGTHMNRS